MIGLKPPISPFTIEYLSRSIRTGELLPSELTGLCLDRIKRFNHVLNSFITISTSQVIILAKIDKAIHKTQKVELLFYKRYQLE